MKLLVLLSRFPYPLDKGDKLRAFHQLRYLAGRHEICLFALSDEDVSAEALAAGAAAVPGRAAGAPAAPARHCRATWLRRWPPAGPCRWATSTTPPAQRQLDKLLQRVPARPRVLPAHSHGRVPAAPRRPLADDAGLHGRVFGRHGAAGQAGARLAAPAAGRWKPAACWPTRRAAFGWFRHHTIISDQDRQLIPHPRRSRD